MANRPSLPNLIEELKTISLFAELDEATLRDLARSARWRDYDAGEVVVMEGEAAPGLYYLESGWLKVVKSAPSGREQVLRFLEPGETFNEIGVFTDQPNPATAIALAPAGVWWLPRDVIVRLLHHRPEFAEHVIAKMAEHMLHLVSLVANLSLRTVTGRLARLLLDDADGDVLRRPRWYTQAELAARLGTVADVIQRALRDLEAQGLIDVERDHIRLRDRAGLEAIAE